MSLPPNAALMRFLRFCMLCWRARAAFRYATRWGCVGMEFDRFGRSLGWRLLGKGDRLGIGLILNPVSIVRYFEFSFAWSCLRPGLGRCLDVASPSLFAVYAAHKRTSEAVTIMNPDAQDARAAARLASALKLDTLDIQVSGVEALASRRRQYDCIWSLSVIEHIAGGYDDSDAVGFMYDALKPGGRLILTFPVDRRFHNEYRACDYYGTQPRGPNGDYFFQRFYDKEAVRRRLIAPIGAEPAALCWFGERRPGWFAQYEQRWMRDGLRCTVEDPREIVDNWRFHESWDAMPGMGVCGLMVQKDAVATNARPRSA